MMLLLNLIALFSAFIRESRANEAIAIVFENWDFGNYNSHSYELLIVVILAIIVLAAFIFIVSLLFRKLFLWCIEQNKYKTCDVEAVEKPEKWLHSKEKMMAEENDEDLEQVLELVRLQGDPAVEEAQLVIDDEFNNG
ncbi:unnamed protein product [Caenorhabditis bovis]|uniref:Uncharacterized protein n=1 Tax=Caenorhabditis bovis TaxID=2654633 RepID=A0A8S1EKU6_9PELO|nr:unnamed protein product [Caenorhabditis bovis]